MDRVVWFAEIDFFYEHILGCGLKNQYRCTCIFMLFGFFLLVKKNIWIFCLSLTRMHIFKHGFIILVD